MIDWIFIFLLVIIIYFYTNVDVEPFTSSSSEIEGAESEVEENSTMGINSFDNFFYINLDKRKDRKNNIYSLGFTILRLK